jgi:hypothetical protein
MKRRKPILLLAAALLLIVPLALIFRNPAPLDLSKDEEPFRSMVLPPKSVAGYRIEEGETVGMAMTDGVGIEYLISFPEDENAIMNAYPNAYLIDPAKLSSTKLKNPERAKSIVESLLKDYGTDTNGISSTDEAIRELSSSLSYLPSRLFKKVKRHFD